MVRKLVKKVREKWHNDLTVQYITLKNQCIDLEKQNIDLKQKCVDLKGHYNDLNMKIMALMKHVLSGKPEDELSFLFDVYGSDKGLMHNNVHPFTTSYHSLFSSIRGEIKAVFECGIFNEASLRTWRDYFENAIIIGGDINEATLFEENRIHTARLDQFDAKGIKDFFFSLSPNYPTNFDIIIDDGCHIYEATICLFENSIDHLKPNGIYVIEDMEEKYFSRYKEYFKKYSEKNEIRVEYKAMSNITGNPNNNLIVIHKA